MGVARGKNESNGLAGHGTVCYHFPVRLVFRAILLSALALTAACSHTLQQEDLSDPVIKARIEQLINGRADLDLRYVSVDVNSGVVTVSGIVPSHEQRRAIERLAKSARGVDQVLNNLVIQE